jgi:capsular exopolysaccharide synthesis family protein
MDNNSIVPRREAPIHATAILQPVRIPAPTAETADRSDAAGLADFARVLYRGKWILLGMSALGIALALAFTWWLPKSYRAEAFLEIQTPNEDFLRLKDVNPSTSPVLVSEDAYVLTQVELIKQRPMIEQTIHTLGMEHDSELQLRQGRMGALLVKAGLRAPLPPEGAALVSQFQSRLTVEPVKRTKIVRIAYESGNAELAAKIVNTLAAGFIEKSIDARRATASQLQSWLEPQLRELQTKLSASEAELSNYILHSGIGTTVGRENLGEERLHSVQQELSRAEAERIAKESQQSGNSSLLDNDTVRQYQLRVTDLRREMADLNTLLTPTNPKVVRVKAQIDELEAAVVTERARIREQQTKDFEAARQRESMLAGVTAQQTASVTEVSSLMVHYNTLVGKVQADRQAYETTLRQLNDARVASVVRPSNVRVAGAAETPIAPFSPNVILNLLAGLCLGGLTGIAIVSVRESQQSSVRMPGETEALLHVPELGLIPATKGGRLLAGPSAGLERISWESKGSPMAESFRAALVSILSVKRGKNGDAARVILVTSPLPADGKTTVASNLAITLGSMGERVLLMDGDLRHPRLHEIYKVANNHGLADFLRGDRMVDAAELDATIWVTGVTNVFLMPSGERTEGLASLPLFSQRMENLMQQLREQYDYIVMDAPPVLPFADARILASHADGVALVLRANRTDRLAASTAASRFAMDGVPVLGTILNHWDAQPTSGYYGNAKEYAGERRG